MNKPEPQVGLVIRYDYLWASDARRGRRAGGKIRPCAIIVSRKNTPNGQVILVAPITHSPPSSVNDAIEIPLAVKRHLGLDDERSWIIMNELNTVRWDDPGIVPVDQRRWVYGFLPPGLVKMLTNDLLGRFRNKKLVMVDRGGIPKS